MLRTALLMTLLTLTGCAGQEIQRKDGSKSAQEFSISKLAKSDIDSVTEFSQQEAVKSLKLLTEKLYKRNPREFRKGGHESAEAATAKLFESLANWKESPLGRSNWEDDFKAVFRDDFNGDRVQTFMGALTAMILASYNHKTTFFVVDELSAQKLYNSARNIEAAMWKLSTAKQSTGEKVLVSNSIEGDLQNLSFEREFGKLIAHQDLMALLIEDKSNRTISRVLQNVASFVFLPI